MVPLLSAKTGLISNTVAGEGASKLLSFPRNGRSLSDGCQHQDADSGMFLDVVDLRDFYASSLGQVTRRLIRRHLRDLWPDVRGQRVLGIGYAIPFLRPFLGEADRVLATMPASQGVQGWPPEAPGLVALTEDVNLPFPDRSFDRIILCHTLENTEHSRALMREVWRVLTDDGRLVVMVPNRQGVWAHLERTPFGSGRPYSESQLRHLLRDTMFSPEVTRQALFLPPTRSRLWLAWAQGVERMGGRWFPSFCGAILIEACKQLYAVSGTAAPALPGRYMALPERLGLSGPKRARPRSTTPVPHQRVLPPEADGP